MTRKQFLALVEKFSGWIDGGVAYFPTVHLRRQFENAMSEQVPA